MLLKKEDIPLIAMDFMNDVHHEEIDLINKIYESILVYEDNSNEENEKIIEKEYKKWNEHTISHFQGEEVKMDETGFPAYSFHKSEHDRELELMEEVFQNWENTKNIQELKEYFENTLPEWLVNHIQSMDKITAEFFKTGIDPCSM